MMMLDNNAKEYIDRSGFFLVQRETDYCVVMGSDDHKYMDLLPNLFQSKRKIVLCGRYTAEGAVTCRAVELPMGFAVIAITYPSVDARRDAVYADDGDRAVSELWDLWDNCDL